MILKQFRWSWGSGFGAILSSRQKSKLSSWSRNYEIELFGPNLRSIATFTATKPTIMKKNTEGKLGEGIIESMFSYNEKHYKIKGKIPSDGIFMPTYHFFPEGFVTKWEDLKENNGQKWYWIMKKMKTLLTKSLDEQQVIAEVDGPPWSSYFRTSKLLCKGDDQSQHDLKVTPISFELKRLLKFTPSHGVGIQTIPKGLKVSEIISMLILGVISRY